MTDSASPIAFRAMRNKSWTKTSNGRASPSAFFRGEADPDTGRTAEEALSFNVESPLSCHKSLASCFGVAELNSGKFSSLGLFFKVDDFPHAELSGMPLVSENKTEAEHIASQLARMSKLIMPDEYIKEDV